MKILILILSMLIFTSCFSDPKPEPKVEIAKKQKEQKEIKPIIKTIIGTTPFKIKFNVYSLGDTPYKTIEWDFGDGTKSSEQNPLKTYSKNGTFKVSCTVEDSLGRKASDYITINILNDNDIKDKESYIFISIEKIHDDKKIEKINISQESKDIQSKQEIEKNIFLKLKINKNRKIEKIKINTGIHTYTLKNNTIDEDGFIRLNKKTKKIILDEISKTKFCQIYTYSNKVKRTTKLENTQILKLINQ